MLSDIIFACCGSIFGNDSNVEMLTTPYCLVDSAVPLTENLF